MARIIGAIIAFALAIAVLKMLIIALLIAGLIFRPTETVGLLIIGGLFTLFATYPVAGIALLALAAVAGIVHVARQESDPKTLLERQMDDPDQE